MSRKDSMLMIAGMSVAAGSTEPRYATVLEVLNRIYTDRVISNYSYDDAFGWRTLWVQYDDEYGDSKWELGVWEAPDGIEVWPVEDAYAYLHDQFQVGAPCGCSHCMEDRDCCGRWGAWSIEVWPTGELNKFNVKLYSSRNV